MPKLTSTTNNAGRRPHGGNFKVVETAEALAKLVAETGMAELKMELNGHVLTIRRKADSPTITEATVPREPAHKSSPSVSLVSSGSTATDDQDFGAPVVSQYVGILQLTHPKSGDLLVEVGGQVDAQQCVGWVVSMGIRHELVAPRSGTVVEVLAEAGEPVEYGQVLMLIQ
jgi:acetyl-CoA carboxylase biotin carboxyl carrier protein